MLSVVLVYNDMCIINSYNSKLSARFSSNVATEVRQVFEIAQKANLVYEDGFYWEILKRNSVRKIISLAQPEQ